MNKDAERENQKELEKLERQIRADEKYIARAQKELERYSRIFEEAAEYLKSLSKAETFRLPDDYPPPSEILQQHFPEMANRCPFQGGWGYDAEHAAVLLKSAPKAVSDEKSDAVILESAFIEKRSREELFFARSGGQRFEEPSFKIVEQTRHEVNGVPYDRILADVSGYHINPWNELKADWEAHDGYKDDPAGREDHLKRKEAMKITYRAEFWFNIGNFL